MVDAGKIKPRKERRTTDERSTTVQGETDYCECGTYLKEKTKCECGKIRWSNAKCGCGAEPPKKCPECKRKCCCEPQVMWQCCGNYLRGRATRDCSATLEICWQCDRTLVKDGRAKKNKSHETKTKEHQDGAGKEIPEDHRPETPQKKSKTEGRTTKIQKKKGTKIPKEKPRP